jgi:hypothetical protein
MAGSGRPEVAKRELYAALIARGVSSAEVSKPVLSLRCGWCPDAVKDGTIRGPEAQGRNRPGTAYDLRCRPAARGRSGGLLTGPLPH